MSSFRVNRDYTDDNLLIMQSLKLGPAATFKPEGGIELIDDKTFIVNQTVDTKKMGFNIAGSTANTTATIATANTTSKTYTIPDVASNASFVVTEGAQTINGVKTFGNQVVIDEATNQLVLDAGAQTTTISAPLPAANRIYTIPDAGADASFLMSAGAQTAITGIKTFTNAASGNGIAYDVVDGGAGGATPQTFDGRVGSVQFTGIADTGAGTDVAAAQVINNSLVTANSRLLVTCESETIAANACFVVKNVTAGAGTITVTLHNAGVATSAAAGVVRINFMILN